MPLLGHVLNDHVDVHAGVGERAEDARPRRPGWSGTPEIVTFASEVSWAIPEMIACSMRSSSFLTHVPSVSEKTSARGGRTPWLRAYSTERSISTFAPDAASSSISSYDDLVQLARVGDDARVGRVHALDVGVDLAHVGAERGRERDRGRVGAAAAERRDVVVGGDALEAGDDHDLAGLERLAHAPRPTSTMRAFRGSCR